MAALGLKAWTQNENPKIPFLLGLSQVSKIALKIKSKLSLIQRWGIGGGEYTNSVTILVGGVEMMSHY
jgi:hypothetical protein